MKENYGKHFTQQITLEDMLNEIDRELSTRRHVYPNWIEQGKIQKHVADYRVLVLEALFYKIRKEHHADQPQPNLFGNDG